MSDKTQPVIGKRLIGHTGQAGKVRGRMERGGHTPREYVVVRDTFFKFPADNYSRRGTVSRELWERAQEGGSYLAVRPVGADQFKYRMTIPERIGKGHYWRKGEETTTVWSATVRVFDSAQAARERFEEAKEEHFSRLDAFKEEHPDKDVPFFPVVCPNITPLDWFELMPQSGVVSESPEEHRLQEWLDAESQYLREVKRQQESEAANTRAETAAALLAAKSLEDPDDALSLLLSNLITEARREWNPHTRRRNLVAYCTVSRDKLVEAVLSSLEVRA